MTAADFVYYRGAKGLDVNGDGHLDLFTSTDAAGAAVVLGNGNGTFSLPGSFAGSGASDTEVRLTDRDNDEVLDLIVAPKSSPDVRVFLGNGDGSFRAATTYTVGSDAGDLALGDFTGDGVTDILAKDVSNAQFTLLIQDSTALVGIRHFSLRTQTDAQSALSVFEEVRNNINATLGTVGAYQGRISVALNNLGSSIENSRHPRAAFVTPILPKKRPSSYDKPFFNRRESPSSAKQTGVRNSPSGF